MEMTQVVIQFVDEAGDVKSAPFYTGVISDMYIYARKTDIVFPAPRYVKIKKEDTVDTNYGSCVIPTIILENKVGFDGNKVIGLTEDQVPADVLKAVNHVWNELETITNTILQKNR